jgi:hypothetical protein
MPRKDATPPHVGRPHHTDSASSDTGSRCTRTSARRRRPLPLPGALVGAEDTAATVVPSPCRQV